MTRSVSESEYKYAIDNYMGWCPDCVEFTREMTEPDAEDYDCPECHERHVVGAENALLMGMFDLEDE